MVCILHCGCFNLFCNVWVCVCVDFVKSGCVYLLVLCVGVLVTRAILFTVFCIACKCVLVFFRYVYYVYDSISLQLPLHFPLLS